MGSNPIADNRRNTLQDDLPFYLKRPIRMSLKISKSFFVVRKS